MRKIVVTNLIIISSIFTCFCQTENNLSNRGTPIFIEDFGNSSTGANKYDIGNTSYNYVINKTPSDGSYLISSRFNWYPTWFDTEDHTENDNKGKALIVNADQNNAGIFFSRKINGLCPSSTYEFSTWLLNLSSNLFPVCKKATGIPGGIPVDVRFEIWDKNNTTLIKSITTGKIYSKHYPQWNRYAVIFETLENQDTVILKIANNGEGGCGNDLALDDIQFSYYGDAVQVFSSTKKDSPIQLCSNTKKELQLNAVTQNKFFDKTLYQWQISIDDKVYKDIPNQKKEILTIPKPLKGGKYYYRVKIAENERSLTNSFCNVVSKPFIIEIFNAPRLAKKLPKFEFKETDPIKIDIRRYTNATSIKWYDSSLKGNLISTYKTLKSTTFSPGEHTVFVQLSTTNCFSKKRIPINFKILSEQPEIKNPEIITEPKKITTLKKIGKPHKTTKPPTTDSSENIEMCLGEEVILDAGIDNYYYDWSTEEYEKTITVYEPGKYVVTITNEEDENYLITKTFYVKLVVGPVINRIISEENELTIYMRELGDYEYSLDAKKFQKSNVFKGLKNGSYQFFARNTDSCKAISPPFYFVKL